MLTMQLDGVDGLLAELRSRAERVDGAGEKVVRDYGRYQHDLTFQLSPYDWAERYDTYHMREEIHVEVVSERNVHAMEVGWHMDDFTAAGFYPYYLVQEFGSLYQAAQPSLGPAWNELQPHFVADAHQAVIETLIEGR